MNFLRFHSLSFVTFVAVALMVSYVVTTAADGRMIRRNEQAVQKLMGAIFDAQEARRIGGTEPPYAFLSELVSRGGLDNLEQPLVSLAHPPPDLEIYKYAGYYLALGLEGESASSGPEGAQKSWRFAPLSKNHDTTKPIDNLGRGFRAMAWPIRYGESGCVVYFVDSRGYLFQGENESGMFEGHRDVPLVELDPYQDLEEENARQEKKKKNKKGPPTIEGDESFKNLPHSFRRKWSFIWELRESPSTSDGSSRGGSN